MLVTSLRLSPVNSSGEQVHRFEMIRDDRIPLIAYDFVHGRANALRRESVVLKMNPDAQSYYVSYLKRLIPHNGIAHERNRVINGLLGALYATLVYK
jgi:hypothetical protein